MSRNGHFSIGATNAHTGIAAGAQTYIRNQGFAPASHDFSSVAAHPAMTAHIARAYDALPEFDRSAVPHFKAMAEETARQFDHLTRSRSRGGLGINVEVTSHDPYDGPKEMFHDLRENNRLRVMSTATTGGHPIFSNMQNDQFRAVHDAFGHVGTGRGFDRHGEEAAFRAHSAMFSSHARRAMATETRGQNSSMVAAGGVFPPQKVAVLPERLTQSITSMLGRRSAAFHGAVAQAREFHSQQFGSV